MQNEIIVADSNPFEIFNKDSTSVLTTAEDKMLTGIRVAFKIEYRVAIFCAVIAVILVGIAMMFHNSNKRDYSENKVMLTRVIIVIGAIFASVGLVSLIVGLALK